MRACHEDISSTRFHIEGQHLTKKFLSPNMTTFQAGMIMPIRGWVRRDWRVFYKNSIGFNYYTHHFQPIELQAQPDRQWQNSQIRSITLVGFQSTRNLAHAYQFQTSIHRSWTQIQKIHTYVHIHIHTQTIIMVVQYLMPESNNRFSKHKTKG